MPLKVPTPYLLMSAVGTVFGGSILLKDALGGEIYKGKEKVTGKTVIITGANTGIGKETALELAKREARVIMACRDMDKCEKVRQAIEDETYNKNVICRKLDLASQASIREFAETINKEEGRLDILINNAGVMACPKDITEEGIEYQLGVNHIGHFLLTNLLLDKLKAVKDGRIINLTCPGYKKAVIDFDDLNAVKSYDKKNAYGQSKLANVLFTTELSKKLRGTNVTVNCVNPGICDTDIGRHLSMSKSAISGTNVTVNCVNPGVCDTDIGRHLSMSKSAISGRLVYPLMWLCLKTARQGAQTTIFCAVSSDVRKISGQYYSRNKEEEIVKEGLNSAAARRLWAISEKWTKLT